MMSLLNSAYIVSSCTISTHILYAVYPHHITMSQVFVEIYITGLFSVVRVYVFKACVGMYHSLIVCLLEQKCESD